MSKIIHFTITAAAVVLGAATLFAQAPASNSASSGDAAKGKDLFLSYTCYGCHGFSAQNGPAGNKLNPMKMTLQGFTALVRKPTAPNRMPSYSAKVITDAQLADIYAYLKTLPNAPPAKDIPLLREIEAEQK